MVGRVVVRGEVGERVGRVVEGGGKMEEVETVKRVVLGDERRMER